jgi:hypothetical protein
LAPPKGSPTIAHFQHGQGGDLPQIHVGGVPDAALRRAHGEEMLHPVAEQALDLRVVVLPIRERDDDRTLRHAEPFGDVLVESDQLGHAVELLE